MMMSRKVNLMVLVLLIITLTGCQLAQADGDISNEDSLIGVFLTIDDIDFYSMIEDTEISMEDLKNGNFPQGKIYADLDYHISTNVETGEEFEVWEYEFPTLNGVFLGSPNRVNDDVREFMNIGYGISNMHFAVGGDKESISGTAYMVPKDSNTVYVNQIYQSSNGEVYVTSGNIYSYEGDSRLGSSSEYKIVEARTITENGVTSEKAFEVEVTVEFIYPTGTMEIIQMDKNDKVLVKNSYEAEIIPERIVLDKDTEYVVVKSASKDIEEVQIYNSNDLGISYFIEEDNGFCVQNSVSMDWGNDN